MTKATCISKIRNSNNGKILQYKIKLDCGKEGVLQAEKLKKAIISKELEVDNLKLTKDNRLIDNVHTLRKRDSLKDLEVWLQELQDRVIRLAGGMLNNIDLYSDKENVQVSAQIFDLRTAEQTIMLDMCITEDKAGNIFDAGLTYIDSAALDIYGPKLKLTYPVISEENARKILEYCNNLLIIYDDWRKNKDSDTVHNTVQDKLMRVLQRNTGNKITLHCSGKYTHEKDICIFNDDINTVLWIKRHELAERQGSNGVVYTMRLIKSSEYDSYDSGGMPITVDNIKNMEEIIKKQV